MNRINTNLIVFVLALAGTVVSVYLTIKYVQHASIWCGRDEDSCNRVASDEAAWGLGVPALKSIPTPALGLLMYVTLAGLSFVRTLISSLPAKRVASQMQWAIASAGVLVSAWLTWREGAVIHSWCKWCVSSAVIICLVFLTATAERLTREPLV